MTGKRITDLLDNAVIAAAEVGEWLLRRVPARDPRVRRAELSREALREVLVAQEAEEEVGEPPCVCPPDLIGTSSVCPRHSPWPPVHDSVSVASGATDTSPPEKSGDSPSHHPSGGPHLNDLIAELKDAVGDRYDHTPTLTSGDHPQFPLWHDGHLSEAFDWEGIALTLLRYFDITRKAQ